MTTGKTLIFAALIGLAAPAQALDLPTIGMPKLFGDETKDGQPPPPGATPDCPEIFLDPGASMLRSPAEADSASVRYQLSVRETARQCVIDGDRISIKVGVRGFAMLGPVGQPGSYSGNLRIAVREIKKDTIVASKIYRAGATVPSGASQAPFEIIADPFMLPVITPKAQDDYEIMIGFTQGGASEPAEKQAQKTERKKRRH